MNQSSSNFNRVMWVEGMLLSPQSFQQLERSILHQFNLSQEFLLSEIFGINELDYDFESLKHGFLSLKKISGIFPDGTAFVLPINGDLPNPLQLGSKHEGQIIYLSLSTSTSYTSLIKPNNENEDTSNLNYQLNASSRYKVISCVMSDEADSHAVKHELFLGVLNPRLCLKSELLPNDVALPILMVNSVYSSGQCNLDEKFLPPLLNVKVNAHLFGELLLIKNLINQRRLWQFDRMSQPQTTSSFEIADFMLYQSLFRYENLLEFELKMDKISPLPILRILINMLSDLSAATLKSTTKLPNFKYSWFDPALNFYPLIDSIKNMLSQVRDRLALDFEFVKDSDNVFVCQKMLPISHHDSRVILAVHALVPDEWFWTRFAEMTVVSDSINITNRVKFQQGGIDIKHLSSAPVELPLQVGWHYYEIEKFGLGWSELLDSKKLAIYTSGDWSGLTFKAWIIQSKSLLSDV